jgi:hypothetical protein
MDFSRFKLYTVIFHVVLFYFKILSIIGYVKEIISSLFDFLTNNFSIIS